MSEQLSDGEFFPPPSPASAEPGEAHQTDASATETNDTGSTADAAVSTPTKRRSRRGKRGGRRRRKARGDGEAGASADGDEPSASGPPGLEERAAHEDEGEEPGRDEAGGERGSATEPRRRRGRRGGRGRRRSKTGTRGDGEAIDDDPEERDEAPARGTAEKDDDRAEGARRRKRGSRGGRRKQKKPDGAVTVETIPGDDDELPELSDLPDEAVLVEKRSGSRRSKKTKGRGRGRGQSRDDFDDVDDSDEPDEPAPDAPRRKRVILVNARDTEEKRVAVIENGRIVDLQMTVKKHVSYVNDIYRGRVVNIESAIGAAFVDFGEGKNGFLHSSDVLPSYGESDWSLEKLLSTPAMAEADSGVPAVVDAMAEGPAGEAGAEDEAGDHASDGAGEDDLDDEDGDEDERPARGRARGRRARPVRHRARVRVPIDKLLKKGQMVAVQITKDAIGDKGPTLTTYVSIPGRYLVLMPSLERTGVSRKIDDERERRRLKRILQSLEIPDGMGVIVRTAGIGRTKTDIKRDLEYLLLAWEDFSKRLRSGRSPAPLYQESDVAIRTMRDLFTPETESVIVDDQAVYDRMIEFTRRLMPEHEDRVRLHEGGRPLFHSHGVEQDFEKIFARRVELPSGGSIVIEQTEALVAIDVNSGRTREEGAEFEDIALKTNLEAVPEIARQIRLRDLGGIIVLDYIDMMRSSSRKHVERATRDALKADRARSKIGRISQFGLLELTRQRLGPGLSKLVYDNCQRCRGTGRRRNASSRAQAIMRRLAAALALKGYTTVEVRAHPDVIDYLDKDLTGEIQRLEQESGREIKLLSVPDQVEDSVLHYLRADGREVRPGGRRKR